MKAETVFLLQLAGLAGLASGQQPLYGQCGGVGWTGATSCVAGATCSTINPYYYQCLTGLAAGTTTAGSATTKTSSGTAATSTSCSSNSPLGGGKFTYLGTNIDGFEWGTSTDGTQTLSVVQPPLTQYGGQDGIGQMKHFVGEGFNTFRLAVGWAYLTNGVATGTFNSANLAKFDALVNGCLGTGAYCIIDLHTYARFNGAIIGQGGPTNDQFAAIWTSIANHYLSNQKIIFGIMNEPHDIPSITTWAATVQAAVTAIRKTGAAQLILLPGGDWQSAAAFLSDGSGDALLGVTNPDGSTTNLYFDLHKYLDSDGSGSHAECVGNFIDSAFSPLASWLRCHGRKALITETGGGNVASCVTYFCQLMTFLQTNSDVYAGVTGWGAAEMTTDYVTSMTPFANGTDQLLVRECYLPYAPDQYGTTAWKKDQLKRLVKGITAVADNQRGICVV